MKSLQESLLKNIGQDEDSIFQNWIDEFNKEYSNQRLIKGKDYTIDDNILNYHTKKFDKQPDSAIMISEKNRPPLGLKFGSCPQRPRGGNFDFIFKGLGCTDIRDIIGDSFNSNIYISLCNKIKVLDLSNCNQVSLCWVMNCDNLNKIIFPKEIRNIVINDCPKLTSIGGCKVTNWVNVENCKSLNSLVGFPKEVTTEINMGHLELDSLEGFPKKAGVVNVWTCKADGKIVDKEMISKYCKFQVCNTSYNDK